MKKNSILVILLIAMSLVSCASMKVEPLDASANSPIAVVSLAGNDEIYWYGEEMRSKGLLGEAFDLAAKEKDDDKTSATFGYTTEFMKSVEELTINALTERGFKILSKEEIGKYDNLRTRDDSKLLKASPIITIDGYNMFTPDQKYIVALAEATGAKLIFQVYYDFTKIMSKGVGKTGEMTAAVEVAITVFNAEGKNIRRITGYASNPERIKVIAGIYDPEELYKMFPSTMETAIKTACDKL